MSEICLLIQRFGLLDVAREFLTLAQSKSLINPKFVYLSNKLLYPSNNE